MNIEKSRDILPRLIYNNQDENKKVLSDLQSNLERCDSFDFSVAFIADSGIACLRQPFLDFSDSKRKARIITSTYLGFNTPKAFRELLNTFENSNVEIRIYKDDGFHPKGYIFKYENETKVIIGSSNITQSALCTNQEWNVSISSYLNKNVVERIKNEFNEQWNKSVVLDENWINEYERKYVPIHRNEYLIEDNTFQPNRMQQEAMESLKKIREDGKDKALLISATGTGKTFLSAFDVKVFDPKKMLFIVHRGTIASKAKETFETIIKNKKMSLLSGTHKDEDSDYIFAVVNTISKDEYLNKYKSDEFDYIIIDEVHKAGAEMYTKILKHFKPKFLLGMSATPERTDNPEKIYEIFEYNIAYEIRLKQAMKYDLLCPFHYYGITDIKIDGKDVDIDTGFNDLVIEERIINVIKSIHKYSYSGSKPHGLIFVSRIEEAKYYAKVFEEFGYKSIALSGENSDDEKEKAIKLLEETDTSKDYYDYIFTVDIFNEGVDIPCINQVVMLRATKSAIIFVQQLGRGLRKHKEKEYVNVIDIIGNYENNYMIPIALSDSRTFNKDDLRRTISNGSSELYGCSTISFDLITKKKIYDSIDNAKLNTLKVIKEGYFNLKFTLGNKIPSLLDFDKFSSIDPLKIFDYSGSYYSFLKKYDEDYDIDFGDNPMKEKVLEFISNFYGAGKRIQEIEFLIQTIYLKRNILQATKDELSIKYDCQLDQNSIDTIIAEMTGKFCVGNDSKYNDLIFIEKDNEDYKISASFDKMLEDANFKKELLHILEFSTHRYIENYSQKYKDTDFVLYRKYAYKDVYRLLNWEKGQVDQNVGGYFYDKKTNTFPVFINYDKTNAKASVQYGDRFIDEKHIIAISKHPRSITSNDAKIIDYAEQNNTKIHLFIRKNREADKKDAKEFYYLGLVNKYDKMIDSVTNNNDKVFEIPYCLDTEVREDIFSYLIS